ncbi:hypothetical protein [Dipodfec virus UOA04_Rod_567]|nr:hypothetical protein [Dipodfec virus UOA04_Rod_567]
MSIVNCIPFTFVSPVSADIGSTRVVPRVTDDGQQVVEVIHDDMVVDTSVSALDLSLDSLIKAQVPLTSFSVPTYSRSSSLDALDSIEFSDDVND